jgi:hypothetical protein
MADAATKKTLAEFLETIPPGSPEALTGIAEWPGAPRTVDDASILASVDASTFGLGPDATP